MKIRDLEKIFSIENREIFHKFLKKKLRKIFLKLKEKDCKHGQASNYPNKSNEEKHLRQVIVFLNEGNR